jgi:hypothetical protein
MPIPGVWFLPRPARANAGAMLAPEGPVQVPATKPGSPAASRAAGRATAESAARPRRGQGEATAGSAVRSLDSHFAGYFAPPRTKVCGV